MTTPATTLSPLLREQVVMALTQTSVVQCTRMLGNAEDGSRCALGVIAEQVFGFTLHLRHFSYYPGLTLALNREDQDRFEQLFPRKLWDNIVWANDILGHSFDQIAKLVKEWDPSEHYPGDPPLSPGQIQYTKITLGEWAVYKTDYGLWKFPKVVVITHEA